ncbi:ATP-dependent DNA/RNA helicase DHX36-like [Prorops nasuta]|uniref:ATP-dependent DNA/RNA helicase DHX36-like n=1 Tax=Prorops nasuta TaxID=863751 RepID=UPI0034CD69CE
MDYNNDLDSLISRELHRNTNKRNNYRLKFQYGKKRKEDENKYDYAFDTHINYEMQYKFIDIDDSIFKRRFLATVFGNIEDNLKHATKIPSVCERNVNFDQQFLDELLAKEFCGKYKQLLTKRLKLPIYEKKDDILKLIQDNQIIIISGETGCGKTTQLGQIILDDEIRRGNGSITKIVCTQPRRIAAVSVAKRVALERQEPLGESTGYQVRFEKEPPRQQASLMFCTTGILLSYMHTDPALKGFSHVIVDEVHERSTEVDFILGLLKMIIKQRKDLKVVIMSATLNAEVFSIYFDNCKVLHIPGLMHEVKEFYLEDILKLTGFKFGMESSNFHAQVERQRALRGRENDFYRVVTPYLYELNEQGTYPATVIDQLAKVASEELSDRLIETVLIHICLSHRPGSVLIFLPGEADIMNLYRRLEESDIFSTEKYRILILYSRLPLDEQNEVFEIPPSGVRKIVLATSIAETSITIEDIVYVIDSGRMKIRNVNYKSNEQYLEPVWISKANAKQRKGRAGRIQQGQCYKLYTRGRERSFDDYVSPDILRTRLEELILRAKLLQIGQIQPFFESLLDTPEMESIQISIKYLIKYGALDEEENLTPMGYNLAQLPLEPVAAKMLIFGIFFSCVDPIFSIAAWLTEKNAFYKPKDKKVEEEAKLMKLRLAQGTFSDHITYANALNGYEEAWEEGEDASFCKKYCLARNTMNQLYNAKIQFAQYLYDMGFLKSPDPLCAEYNRNSKNNTLIIAVVAAALYPNIAVETKKTKYTVEVMTDEKSARIHPSSVNAIAVSTKSEVSNSRYVTYYTKQVSSLAYLYDTSYISENIFAFAVLCSSKGQSVSMGLSLDNLRRLYINRNKQKIEKFHEFLSYKFTHPGSIYKSVNEEQELIKSIIKNTR